jgi:hypothetical protein
MSSKRRAAVKFPIQYSLFVNQKALYRITGMTKYYRITGMTKYYIKSASGGEGSFAAIQGSSRNSSGTTDLGTGHDGFCLGRGSRRHFGPL